MNKRVGVGIGLMAGALFGTSGTFGKALLSSGWSSPALITCRVAGAGLLLLPLALLSLKGRWQLLWACRSSLLKYGIIAIAGTQLFYFNSLRTLPVSVAMILEYVAPFLVVLWLWCRRGRRPRAATLAALAIAVGGLILMVDFTGTGRLDLMGVAWGVASAVCSAAFFIISADTDDDLPSVVLVCGGMLSAAAALGALAVLGALPWHVTARSVVLLDAVVPWWQPLVGLVVLSAALPYLCSTIAIRVLGAEPMSFIAMFEVIAACVYAAVLLGEIPTVAQLLGGGLILSSVVLVNINRRQPERIAQPEVVDNGTVVVSVS